MFVHDVVHIRMVQKPKDMHVDVYAYYENYNTHNMMA